MASRGELALLRLVGQGLVGDQASAPGDVVRAMGALQGQDLPGALTSVALRTSSRDLLAVRAAIDDGAVVRSWPMRGTLHLVPGEDLGWMLGLTAERLMAGAARRRTALDLTDADIERARDLAVEALRGGRSLDRQEMARAWADGGVSTDGQRGYHLIWALAQTGTLCWGPLQGTQQRLVLLDEWVARPRRLERDEALGEWALRYFRSHGPATTADFSWWTKLVAADVRAGVALARPELAEVTVDGTTHLMDPATPDRLREARKDAQRVLLLPGFDEFLLGYGDRSPALAPEFAARVCPGGGMFSPTVVSGGQVIGTWKRVGTGARRTITATPFTTFRPSVEKAITKAYVELPAESRPAQR